MPRVRKQTMSSIIANVISLVVCNMYSRMTYPYVVRKYFARAVGVLYLRVAPTTYKTLSNILYDMPAGRTDTTSGVRTAI